MKIICGERYTERKDRKERIKRKILGYVVQANIVFTRYLILSTLTAGVLASFTVVTGT